MQAKNSKTQSSWKTLNKINSRYKETEPVDIPITNEMKHLMSLTVDQIMAEQAKLAENIFQLEQYRKACTNNKQQDFVQASKITERINEIIQKENDRLNDVILQKQEEELKETDDKILQHFLKFNEIWENIIQDFIQQSEREEIELRQKLEQEMVKKRELFINKLKVQSKPNPEIVNMKKSIQVLAKRKEYEKAQQLQEDLIKLQQSQQQK